MKGVKRVKCKEKDPRIKIEINFQLLMKLPWKTWRCVQNNAHKTNTFVCNSINIPDVDMKRKMLILKPE